jgi:D-alanyl-D-alanine carboxypeptidase
MAQHGRLAGLAIATILLGAVAFAQTIDQLNPGASGSAALDQLGTIDRRDAEDVQQIAPASGGGIDVEQPTGRDLCDPQVSEAMRRAAGIDCQSDLRTDGMRPRTGIANDPLLTPRDKTLKDDFNSLGLGDDVPATVILQQ